MEQDKLPQKSFDFEFLYRRLMRFFYSRYGDNEQREDFVQKAVSNIINILNKERVNFETEDQLFQYAVRTLINLVREAHRKKTEEQLEDKAYKNNERLKLDYAIEILSVLKKFQVRTRLAIFFKHQYIYRSISAVLSDKYIAKSLEIPEGLLYKIADEIPISDEDLDKYIMEYTQRDYKTDIRKDRWKGLKILKDETFFRRRNQ